jgi:outer membrane protein assembly factor BamE (lipoprotein component of BamABCDE complex)
MKTLKKLSIILLLTSCSSIKHHGQYIDDDEIKLVVSKNSKVPLNMDEVFEIIGTPNFRSEIPNSNKFYYMYRSTSYSAFFTPKTIKQRIVEVKFNKSEDKLLDIKVIDGNFNDNIQTVNLKTLSPTNEQALLNNYFANFRRFTKKENVR